MQKKVTKAVFPVAGLGTRFLPATKSIPKEILTLVDRPLIQYAVDEAREAGITEFIFVTSRGKSLLEDHFDQNNELEAALLAKGKHELLEQLKLTNMESGTIAAVRQNNPRGLGHAVWCARNLIGDEPFAVLLPDDVIKADRACLAQMIDSHAETGGNVVAAMEVTPAQTSSYGVLDIASQQGRVVQVKGMVEKPAAGTAPSNLAVIGRYILTPQVLRHLDKAEIGAGGEIQLTDAIAKETAAGQVFGYHFEGDRYDCGSKSGLVKATVAFALSRDDLRDELTEFLAGLNK